MYMGGYTAPTEAQSPAEWSWSSVYGFDMSCIGEAIAEQESTTSSTDALVAQNDTKKRVRANVVVLDASQICTSSTEIADFDLMAVSDAELDFKSSFTLTAAKGTPVDGLCVWFDNIFSGSNSVTLHTGPEHTPTHWKQTLLPFARYVWMYTCAYIFLYVYTYVMFI
jgi:hypothetical protein